MKSLKRSITFLMLIFIVSNAICQNNQRGTFVDDRDGREYKWVRIGAQTWMAENLNFDIEGSKIPRSKKYREEFGRYYSYQEANLACPEGWKTPSSKDFEQLGDYISVHQALEQKGSRNRATIEEAGSFLIEPNDYYGFSVLFSGIIRPTSLPIQFTGVNKTTAFWTSDKPVQDAKDQIVKVRSIVLSNNSDNMKFWYETRSSKLSVRCIKN